MENELSFRERMSTITVPEGFTAEMKAEKGWKEPYLCFVLSKPDDTEIKFDQTGNGHTRFKTTRGWHSFDRIGVEDSFYHVLPFERKALKNGELNLLVKEQLELIEKSREYYKTAINIPSLPFTVAPDKVEDLKKQLAKRGHISFTPSGFGTGYMVTKKPQRGCRYGETRAKAELEAFLGQSPLYVSTLDCD